MTNARPPDRATNIHEAPAAHHSNGNGVVKAFFQSVFNGAPFIRQ